MFNFLKEIGYQKLLIYDNTGVYLISLEIENQKALEQLNIYLSVESENIRKFWIIIQIIKLVCGNSERRGI